MFHHSFITPPEEQFHGDSPYRSGKSLLILVSSFLETGSGIGKSFVHSG